MQQISYKNINGKKIKESFFNGNEIVLVFEDDTFCFSKLIELEPRDMEFNIRHCDKVECLRLGIITLKDLEADLEKQKKELIDAFEKKYGVKLNGN